MIIPSNAQGVELPTLSPEEMQRYSRHLILPEVGIDGQKRLKNARVLLIGSGGLGAPLGMYLAAAGVGTIGLVDFDVVDVTNLQRQIIHGTKDVGRPKIDSASDRIHDINPLVKLEPHNTRLSSENALDLFREYDIVIDGTDNFPTRYLVNDACVLLGMPNVYGSIFRFDGQATVFWAEHGPCYRCLYPEPPPPGMVPSCAEGGVIGILPGIVGCIQANEAVKLILGVGTPLIGRLLTFAALEMRFRDFKLRKDPDCPICGENRTINELIDYEVFCGLPQAGQAEESEAPVAEIAPRELKALLDTANGDAPFVLDVRNPEEYEIARIQGTTLIPLPELEDRLGELDPSRPMVVHCKSGARSARAVKLLQEKGFKDVKNLSGGILAWAEDVDPTLVKY